MDVTQHLFPTIRRCRRRGFDPWVRKNPWRRKWQPTPVCLPGKFYGQRSLAGYSPWCCKESDMTEYICITVMSKGLLIHSGNSHFPDPFTVLSSVQFSHSVVSDSLRLHELQHARPPCPSPTPGVHSDAPPSSQ